VLAEMDFHTLGMTTAFPSLPDQAAWPRFSGFEKMRQQCEIEIKFEKKKVLRTVENDAACSWPTRLWRLHSGGWWSLKVPSSVEYCIVGWVACRHNGTYQRSFWSSLLSGGLPEGGKKDAIKTFRKTPSPKTYTVGRITMVHTGKTTTVLHMNGCFVSIQSARNNNNKPVCLLSP
jgi:hypothetical protein